MKKKIALMLAALMAFACVPAISLSAAAEVNLIGGDNSWSAKTLSYSSNESLYVNSKLQTVGTADFSIGDEDVEVVANAATLEVKDIPSAVAQFTVRITGGIFMYAKGLTANKVDGITFPTDYDSGSFPYWFDIVSSADSDGKYDVLDCNYYDSDTGTTEKVYTLYITDSELLVDLEYSGGVRVASTIEVPLAIYMDDASDVRVRITDAVDTTNRSVSGITSSYQYVNYKSETSNATVTGGDVVSGKDWASLENITIKESVRGSVKEGGTIKFSLSNGYMFDDANTVPIWKQTFGDTYGAAKDVNGDATGAVDELMYFFDKDYEVLYIIVPTITKTSSARTFKISGLAIMNTDDNDNPSGDVTLTVKGDYDKTKISVTTLEEGVSGAFFAAYNSDGTGGAGGSGTVGGKGTFTAYDAGLKSSSFVVATFNDYSIVLSFSSGSYAKGWSGQSELEIDTVKIAESVPKSWVYQRDFTYTLVDADGNQLSDVKFFGNSTDSDIGFEIDDENDCAVAADYPKFESGFERTVRLDTSKSKESKIQSYTFNLKLNTSAAYVGDVYLRASGRAVGNDVNLLKIAEIKAPLSISTRKTSVPIGKQTYSVADIYVTEAAAGLLQSSGQVYVYLREFLTSTSSRVATDLAFNPITSSQVSVSEGNLTLGVVDSDSYSVSVKIKRQSTTASTIKLSGLAIKITGSAPQGTYDLLMTDEYEPYGDNAVIRTYDPEWSDKTTKQKDNTDLFGVQGIGYKGYVEITNTTANEVLAKNVLVEIGSDKAWVDSLAITLSAPTFLDTSTNRTMLPVRAIAEVFSISAENIIWSDVNRTVTLLTTNRTIQFTIDSDSLMLNGTLVPMVDEAGRSVKAIISNGNDGGTLGRTYVPFRQLAKALGIEVLWIQGVDGDRDLVALNPSADQYELAEKNAEIGTAVIDAVDEEIVDEVDEETTAEERR